MSRRFTRNDNPLSVEFRRKREPAFLLVQGGGHEAGQYFDPSEEIT